MAVVEEFCEVVDSLVLTPVGGGVLLCVSEAVATRGAELCVSLVAAMPREACEVERPRPVVGRVPARGAGTVSAIASAADAPPAADVTAELAHFASTAWALIAWPIPTIVVRTAPPKILVPAWACPDRAAVKSAVLPARRPPELLTASTITASPAASATAAAPHERIPTALRERRARRARVIGQLAIRTLTAASAARSAVPLGRLCAPLAIALADAAEVPSLASPGQARSTRSSSEVTA